MEPTEYFTELKTNLKGAKKEEFDSQMEVIGQQILAAERIGQQNFLDRLAFTFRCVKKEQELCALGITQYILKDNILKFLDKVTPKNSIKIIELARYPRPIPTNVLEKIEEIKKLEIFDDFFVVFTDFTEQNYETAAEKALVARNRDPVVFGWFRENSTNYKHDRIYFVADWIDDYCDLDFSKLLEEMSKRIPGHAPSEIKPGVIDFAALNDKVEEILKKNQGAMISGVFISNSDTVVTNSQPAPEIKKDKTFWQRIFRK